MVSFVFNVNNESFYHGFIIQGEGMRYIEYVQMGFLIFQLLLRLSYNPVMSLHGVVMYQTRPADETLDALSNFLPIYFITPCWWGRYQNSNNARPADQYGSCTLFLKINLLEIQRTESLINWSKYVPRDLRNSSGPQPGPPGPFGGSGPPLTIPRIEQILSK